MLENRGHQFSSDSDTEVILHGYEEFGIDILDKLDGMFAFCIYDQVANEWIIGRDRIGEKPLYYYKNDDFIIFGSELKSLLATNLVPRELDMSSVSVYFQLTYIPAPMTILKDVFKLPAASYMKISASGDVEIKQYWQLDLNAPEITDYEEAKKQLRQKVFESVESRMISDVPLGAFLSGGFDSSTIVGVMSQISSQPVNTFTIGFKEKQYDESHLAEIVAKRNKTNHTTLFLDWDECVGDLDTLLNNIDEPFADSSLIATYFVSRLAKKYVTVVLTGDSGDELFAGYDKYLISYYANLYKKVPSVIRNGVLKPGINLLPKSSSLHRKASKVINNFDLDIYEQRRNLMCLGFNNVEIRELLRSNDISDLEFIRATYEEFSNVDEQKRAQYTDLKIVLEGDMLPKVDRASMLPSLETRVPLLSRDIVELAFRIPSKYKIQGKQRKIILKDTFKDLLPDELFHAPKHGFGVPVGKWLKNDLKPLLSSYLDKDFIESQGIFNYPFLSILQEKHQQSLCDNSFRLWPYLVFQYWYTKYFFD